MQGRVTLHLKSDLPGLTFFAGALKDLKDPRLFQMFDVCYFHMPAHSLLLLLLLLLPLRLTLEQKELCRSRLKLLTYLDRLATYEVNIAGHFRC